MRTHQSFDILSQSLSPIYIVQNLSHLTSWDFRSSKCLLKLVKLLHTFLRCYGLHDTQHDLNFRSICKTCGNLQLIRIIRWLQLLSWKNVAHGTKFSQFIILMIFEIFMLADETERNFDVITACSTLINVIHGWSLWWIGKFLQHLVWWKDDDAHQWSWSNLHHDAEIFKYENYLFGTQFAR